MSIINFTFDHNQKSYLDGAYCPLNHSANEGGRKIILWETYKGLCLSEREANHYHDSDFYMLIWNEEENKPREILFASTRGWSYPSYASYADASQEVINKYDAWKCKHDRKVRIQKRWNKRLEDNLTAAEARITRRQLIKLRNNTGDYYPVIIRLLNTRNFRSKFRKSCADQVRQWLETETPKFRTPLSKKQLSYLS